VPIIVLSKKIAMPIDYGVTVAVRPAGLVGFIVAALILSPSRSAQFGRRSPISSNARSTSCSARRSRVSASRFPPFSLLQ